MDRTSALKLLKSQHTFPGPFDFRAVVRRADVTATLTGLSALIEGVEISNVDQRESRKGTYVSLRVTMHLAAAEQVFEVYETLHAMDGVLTTL